MNHRKQAITSANEQTVIEKHLNSRLRCHAAGVAATLLMALPITTTWVSGKGQKSELLVGTSRVSRGQAIRLVSQADQIRSAFLIEQERTFDIRSGSESVKEWIRDSMDWNKEKDRIEQLASQLELTVLFIRSEGNHNGQLIGGLNVQVEVRGTYDAIMRFLHALPQAPYWMDCQTISLSDTNANTIDSVTGLPVPICAGTIGLRIPLITEGSEADKLLNDSV